MPSLASIAATAPELVSLARTVLGSCPNAVLGTYRRDSSIRLSGIDPVLLDGEIVIGSMPGARKVDDLRRNPRAALHSIPWESRKVREGEPHIEGDIKLDCLAVELLGAEHEAIDARIEELSGFRPGPESPLFRLDVTLLSAVQIVPGEANGQMEISTWTAPLGLRTRLRD